MPMMVSENYSKNNVSSSRYEVGKISETKEVYGVSIVDMPPIMEAMNHNKKGVPSLIKGIEQSGGK